MSPQVADAYRGLTGKDDPTIAEKVRGLEDTYAPSPGRGRLSRLNRIGGYATLLVTELDFMRLPSESSSVGRTKGITKQRYALAVRD
jgi:hypothetical protein